MSDSTKTAGSVDRHGRGYDDSRPRSYKAGLGRDGGRRCGDVDANTLMIMP